MYYIDPKIQKLNRIYDQNGRNNYLRLDLNENPGGLPREVVLSVLQELSPQLISQYPETKYFTEELANYLGTDSEHLCLVNGSAEGIRFIIQAFTSKKGKIIGVNPSYRMFQIYSEMYDREYVEIPYNTDLSMNIQNILHEMTEDTQLLILLNPNNPIGNTYTEEEFESVLIKAKEKQITLLIDEAYYYFCPKTFIKYAIENKHIFITRTFSKLLSMAGCRLGYIVGWPEGIKIIQKMCTPHNINVLAIKLAEKLIANPIIIDHLINSYIEGRDYLINWLEKNNYSYKVGAGNFILIKPKTNTQNVAERMKTEKKVLIKTYKRIGRYGDCIRVTIGEKKYMELFISALRDIDC